MDEVTGVVGVVVDVVGAGDAVAAKETYEWFWRMRVKDMKRYPGEEGWLWASSLGKSV